MHDLRPAATRSLVTIVVAALGTLGYLALPAPRSLFSGVVALAAGTVWAYLEAAGGITRFRRLVGATVLAALVLAMAYLSGAG